MAPAPELTPELAERFKEARSQVRYEYGKEKMAVLAQEVDMEEGAFRKLILASGWRRRQPIGPRSPRVQRIQSFGRARPSASPPAAEPAPDIATLVERQLSAIDRILQDLRGAEASEPERHARTIASVSRTLKELLRMRAQAPPGDDKDDDMPKDIDEFRRELARRIRAFVASRTDGRVADGGEAADT